MSLYGRRPSVVRSLASGTSLMTTPSSETTIFGMADSWISFVVSRRSPAVNASPSLAIRMPAPRRSLEPALARTTEILSFPPLSFAVATKSVAFSGSPISCNKIVKSCASGTISLKPVGAQQEQVARLHVVLVHFESTWRSTPSARVTRFRCGDRPACSGVIAPASICSCSSEWSRVSCSSLSAAQPVAARVADVADHRRAAGRRRPAPASCPCPAAAGWRCRLRGSRGWRCRRRSASRAARPAGWRCGPACASQRPKLACSSAIGHAAGHLAGVVAAHAVGQQHQAERRRRRRSCPRCWRAPGPGR